MGAILSKHTPCVIVTEQLAEAIEATGLNGAELDEVLVTKDPQFEQFYPELSASLPNWRWLKATGRPEWSDFWQGPDASLVVRPRALQVLNRFNLRHCEILEI